MSLTTPQANAVPQAPSAGIDNLTCQWQGCAQPNHPSPEALYEHVCETHIGRKSTNNLNLQCFWGACRTTTVKRDHITSHIRVHVPLKPHKCDFCGKSFKRPQDLKKHVKTHADESVLLNSPQTGAGASRSQVNGYHGQANGKSSGFYGDGGMGPNMNYGPGYPNMQTGGYGHYPSAPGGAMQGTHYAAPQYSIPQMSSYGGSGLTESRKRTHDALNDFFGSAKRGHIDPNSYLDLRQFNEALSMMTPGGSGFQGGYNSGFGGGMNQGGGGVAYQAQPAPMMQPGYGMAFPELRTKTDLLSIDQFLEQLQNTVYDNPAEMAATGTQPVATMVHTGMNMPVRSSHSPPHMHSSSVATPSAQSSASLTHSSTMEDTPALTPASFQASHSPSSSTQQMHSPASRPAGTVGYPSLPSFSSLENQSNQFAQGPTGGIPPSALGSQFDDYDSRRRHSGGHLQRARASPPTDTTVSPPSRSSSTDKDAALTQGVKNVDLSTSPPASAMKLPGVAQITGGEGERPASEGEGSKSASPETEEASRKRNIRVIEQLRQYVQARLARNEFENDEDESGKATPRAPQSDTEMADADADDSSSRNGSTPKREGPGIAYPNLSKATEM